MAEPTGDVDVQLAQTRQRVAGLEQTFQSFANSISAQIGALSTKLDERSRTPWATLLAGMGIVIAVMTAGGQLAKAPIDQAITRLERDVENSLPSDRFNEFKNTYESNRIVGRQDNDTKFAALVNQVSVLAAAVVPRGENEEHWRSIDTRAGDLQRQLDDLKKTFGDTFSLRDALQQMQARIDKLEAEKSAAR